MPAFPVSPSADTAWFLEGCRREEFLLLRRASTGEWFEPSTDRERFDDLVPARASGSGTIVSWSASRAMDAAGETVQRTFGIIELEEGPWWWGELCSPTDGDVDLCGRRVTVRFRPSGSETGAATLPVFVVDADRSNGAAR